jgi:hypothetical protein
LTLSNARASAKRIQKKAEKDLLKIYEENEVKTSPGSEAFMFAHKRSKLIAGISRLPPSISTPYWKSVEEERFIAFKKAKKMSRSHARESVKKHKNNWCKIPEYLILRSEHKHQDSGNIEKKYIVKLPEFYKGPRIGPLHAIHCWENLEPGDENYGSFSRSFAPIENPKPKVIPGNWIPSKEDLISFFDNYHKASQFCNKDPMAALIRAASRDEHCIFNINIEGLRPNRECPIQFGDDRNEFGIEFHGMYFFASGKDATEALLLTDDEKVWRGILYRRAIYDYERKLPVEISLSMVNEFLVRKPKEEPAIEYNSLTENILQELVASVEDIFGVVPEKIPMHPVIEEEQDTDKESESEDSESDDDDIREDVIKLRRFYAIARETFSDSKLESLKDAVNMDYCLNEKFSEYDEYCEEMYRQLSLEEKEYEVYPEVGLYYNFMIDSFRNHSNRSLKNLITYLCDRFKVRRSLLDEEKVIEVEPEITFVESENLSIFQIEALNVIQKTLDDTLDDFEESYEANEENLNYIKELSENASIMFDAFNNLEFPEKREIEDLNVSQEEVDIYLDSRFDYESRIPSRSMTRLSWIVEILKGIG